MLLNYFCFMVSCFLPSLIIHLKLYIFEMRIHVIKNKDRFSRHVDLFSIKTRNKSFLYIPMRRIKNSLNSPKILDEKLFNKLPVDIENNNSTTCKKD